MANIKAKLEVQAYVNGNLVERSKWVQFPQSDDGLVEEVVELVKDKDGMPRLPSFAKRMVRIVEWDVPSFMEDKFNDDGWALNLDKVNECAEDLKDIRDDDIEVVEAMLDDGSWSLSEALSIVRNGNFTDFRNDSEEDIVRRFLEDDCGRRVPDYILDNVDWESAFDDLKDDRCGSFLETDNGWVYID